jgi:3-methyladenine DNA glycosylase AlkC
MTRTPEHLPPALRAADVSLALRAALSTGALEPRTLTEWTAIDQPHLARIVAHDLGVDTAHVSRVAGRVADEPLTVRIRAIARAFVDAAADDAVVIDALATHRIGLAREWAAYAVGELQSLELTERLALLRPLARDGSFSVREAAWMGFRAHVAADLDLGLRLLEGWVRDPDPNVRRCAVEGTRPRGVWCRHIPELRRDPERAAYLLEPVRSDGSDYVRRSVANWINDASKDRPEWAVEVTNRWRRESPTPETEWIARHALRTLRRLAGGPQSHEQSTSA